MAHILYGVPLSHRQWHSKHDDGRLDLKAHYLNITKLFLFRLVLQQGLGNETGLPWVSLLPEVVADFTLNMSA